MTTTAKKVNTTAVRTPTDDPQNHTIILRQLKETTEVAQRLRGDPLQSFVRLGELVSAGVVRIAGQTVQSPSTNAPPGSAVPSARQVLTINSLTGGGNLGADLTLQLVGDAASPGNLMLYGTNASGARGWYAQPAGGAASPLTTKGDIYVFGVANTRLSVGLDTQVLTADSTQATGLKWAPPSGAAGSSNNTPDTHPSTANPADDEFEVGSSIDTAGTRFGGATAWTAFSLSTGSTKVRQGSLVFLPALTAGRNCGGYTHPVSGSWGYTVKFTNAVNAGNTLLGMFVATASGATGPILLFGFNGTTLVVQRLTNSSTFSANQLATVNAITSELTSVAAQYRWYYLRVTYDGTNLQFFISASGIEDTFVQVYTETSAAFLGAPAFIGIGGDGETAATPQPLGIYDWFRKTS